MRQFTLWLLLIAAPCGLAAQTFNPTPAIHTVFLIVLENLRWSEVKGSAQAPYINNVLLPQAAHAEQYMAAPNVHPSLPNYLWLEAGSNFGIYDDNLPPLDTQTSAHLTTAVEQAGNSWGAWVENITGTTCPLGVSNDGLYTPAVNPSVYFDDVTGNSNPQSAYCIAHQRPFTELAAALKNNTVPNLNWITANLCDDGHSCPLSTADNWLSALIPEIMASSAYKNGGAIFLTWDEVDTPYANLPVGMLVLSPAAKPGYSNSITYTHLSTLRTIEEIFGLTTFFNNAASSNDLSDLFQQSNVSLTPTSLSFSPQGLGTPSPTQGLTLANNSGATLTISSVAIGPGFEQTNTCGASLAAGDGCTFAVDYLPTAGGPASAQLTVVDTAAGSPQSVQLSGQVLGGALSLSASTLDFGGQAVNSTSAAATLTLTNVGTTAVSVNSITASGPFAAVNSCGTSLAEGASCTVRVAFSPVSPGAASGTLTLADNAGDAPQLIALTGDGQGPLIVISTETVNFPGQALTTTSTPQSFTLQNSGNLPLAITATQASGPFLLSNNCGSSVAVGVTCTYEVQFAPVAAGAATGELVFSDNAPDSPQDVHFTGTGLGPGATLSTQNLSFAALADGGSSAPQLVTLTNSGTASLTLSPATITGPFSDTTTCGATLAAAAACSASVVYHPAAGGGTTGILAFADNAPTAPQQLFLTAAAAGAVADFASVNISFPATAVGATATQTVTLSNPGSSALNFTAVAVTGPFAQSSNCGLSLAAGATCTASFTFTPTGSGAASGTLTLDDNAATSPQILQFSGTGQAAAMKAPALVYSPSSLAFGSQAVGTVSAAQSFTITNTGTAALAATSSSLTGPFQQTNNCPASLAAGAKCTVTVTFAPTMAGAASGAITLNDNASGSPHIIVFTGTGQ